jgi:5'-nucleotidase
MNILVSNDDGYQCEGIIRLASALRSLGHRALMISPDRDRSGASHSISLASGHIDVKEIAADTWICSGTPADCVIAVLSGGVSFRPDAVVSGINAGCNLGTDILFSGTVAAAREGALYDIPSIAFSLAGSPPYFWNAAALWAASRLEPLLSLWKKESLINVNLPNIKVQPDDYVITFPSRRNYTDSVKTEPAASGWKRLMFNDIQLETMYEAGSDHNIVNQNKISVSPIYIYPVSGETP